MWDFYTDIYRPIQPLLVYHTLSLLNNSTVTTEMVIKWDGTISQAYLRRNIHVYGCTP